MELEDADFGELLTPVFAYNTAALFAKTSILMAAYAWYIPPIMNDMAEMGYEDGQTALMAFFLVFTFDVILDNRDFSEWPTVIEQVFDWRSSDDA